jgi:hypothetical protein
VTGGKNPFNNRLNSVSAIGGARTAKNNNFSLSENLMQRTAGEGLPEGGGEQTLS